MPSSPTLHRAMLGAVALAIVAGLLPAALVLDRRLASALEERSRSDLAMAPRIFADRMTANSDAMMMHAKELAHVSALGDALIRGDHAAALRVLDASRPTLGGEPVLVGPNGEGWWGQRVDEALLARTRAGEMPVVPHRDGRAIGYVALAPVTRDGRWAGAAGLSVAIDERMVAALAGLTRSSVIVLADGGGAEASTLDSTSTEAIARAATRETIGGAPSELAVADRRLLVVSAPLVGAGTVLFVRELRDELAVLPELRRVAALSALAALLVALALGALMASRIARPVRQLAGAATALSEGQFGASLPTSAIREVSQLAAAFDEMRRTLAARLDELREVNASLTDRNARLSALQSDLMQRDRLAATGRLVAQLAHEIRNPVASLHNCLELVRRRVTHDPEALEFVELASDELLRMHELAEQMLELNRPRDAAASRCRPRAIAHEVMRLVTVGVPTERLVMEIAGDDSLEAAIGPDALKQVLHNLAQNARDAVDERETVRVSINVTAVGEQSVAIEVRDAGPGIDDAILGRIFDPFFSTKRGVRGVGLGLFVAEGLVRAAGGRIDARNVIDADGSRLGACFRIELPRPVADESSSSRDAVTAIGATDGGRA